MPQRPETDEYAAFAQAYVDAVPEGDVLSLLEEQPATVARFAAAVGADRELHRYAAGKWTLREVFGHMVDAERVFGYRAFRLAHRDATPLSSFEENDYVANGRYDDVSVARWSEEFALVRESNLRILRRVAEAEWAFVGAASGKPVTLRALAYLLAGHVEHHLRLVRDRYGIEI